MYAPAGMSISATGLVSWQPTEVSPALTGVVIRVYDRRGGFAQQAFGLDVLGGNSAPVVADINAVYSTREGQAFALALQAQDPDSQLLSYYANNLPAGAVFDPLLKTLIWTPGYAQAGLYRGISLSVTDGIETVTKTFDLVVLPTNAAPLLGNVPNRTVREGDPIRINLNAFDFEGDALEFYSAMLPPGAFLDPNTGVFEWTPSFVQHGTFEIPFSVTDGLNVTRTTTTITVLNANGAPVFDEPGSWVVLENQPIAFIANALDPDNPLYELPVRDPNGNLVFLGDELPRTITYSATGLPPESVFDTETGLFHWRPGYTQAGSYVLHITATDTGDGVDSGKTTTIDVPILVGNVNRAPDLAGVSNVTVAHDTVYEIPVSSVDPDGNPVHFAAAITRQATGNQLDLDVNTYALGAGGRFATFLDNGNGTGVLRFAPLPNDRGNYIITLRAIDDGDGGTSPVQFTETQFVLTVTAPSVPPSLDFIGDKVALIGNPLTFDVHATDLDQDDLTFSATGLPAAATLTPLPSYGSARIQFTPGAAAAGTYDVTIRVTDNGNDGAGAIAFSERTFRLVVRAANEAPLLLPIGNREVNEGGELLVQLSAIDPDGDGIAYSATNLPPGATLDTEHGVIRFTPNYFQQGEYAGIVITASDGDATSTETITIKVNNANRAPVIAAMYPQTGREGNEITFTLAAADLDGDPVVYTMLSPLPAGAAFVAKTGKFIWTPGFEQAGDYTFRFAAVDPSGAISTTDVKVSVANVNRAPVFDPSNHAAILGVPLEFTVLATDPDLNTTLTYAFTGLPDGSTFNAQTGAVRWVSGPGQAGDYLVRATVSDGKTSVTSPFVIRATNEPIKPNVTVELTPSFPVLPGQQVLLHVAASGFIDIASLNLVVDGQTLALDSQGRVRFNAGGPGKITIIATATDKDGNVGTITKELKVRNPADTQAPVVSLDISQLGQKISVPTDLLGQVSDLNLDSWTLEIAHFNTETFSVLASGGAPVSGSLIRFNPDTIENGFYRLRLRAIDIAGRIAETESLIEVSSTAKTGRYLRDETDVTVTLAGHQVAITRQYNSFQANEAGTFGDGWRLALRDIQMESNVASNPATGQFDTFREGSRVYLRLPDGERVGFTFTGQLHTMTGLKYYTPAFVADSGVTWNLSLAETKLIRVGDRYFDLLTSLPYNPMVGGDAPFRLTAPDGTVYSINATSGTQSIQFADGVVVVVADSGLVAQNGDAVAFIGGPGGEITGILAPNGDSYLYTYDDRGLLQSVRDLAHASSVRYGYDATGAHRLVLATGTNGGAIDYTVPPIVTPIASDLGSALTYLAAAHSGGLGAGESDLYSFIIRDSEIAAANNGSIYLGVVVTAQNGSTLAPSIPTLSGLAPIAFNSDGTSAFALFKIDHAGLQLLKIAGQNAGNYSFEMFVAGDANRDGKVDGVDAALLESAAGSNLGDPGYQAAIDFNRDRRIDSTDRQLLFQNIGFATNRAPTVSAATFMTHTDLQVVIPISQLLSDPESDAVFARITNVTHGTARLSGNGLSVIFTPDATFSGQASFSLVADDGVSTSAAVMETVNVSAAKLVAMDLRARQA